MELAIIEATAEAAPHQSNDQNMVSCDICDKQFKNVSSRNKHLKIHFDGLYFCKFCGKRFKEIGNRNRHENQVHNMQQLQCTKCEKKFKLSKSLKAHMLKKHSGEEDSDGVGAAEAPVAAVPSTLEQQKEVEDLEMTLEAVEGDMEEVEEVEVEVCLTDHLDVLDNSAWVSNEVTLSSGGAEEEEEASDKEELLPPENMDMEDHSEANTAVTTGLGHM